MNHLDYLALNNHNVFTAEGLRLFLHNVVIVAQRRSIDIVAGISPIQYEQLMESRIGNEPIIRLAFVIIRDITHSNMSLAEVLARDPLLFIEALEQSDINIYYNVYSQN